MKTKYLIFGLIASFLITNVSLAQIVEGVDNNSNNKNESNTTVVQQQNTTGTATAKSAVAAAELINYQAVARDGSGDLIISSAVTIDIEIRDGAGGAVVFSETHNVNTDENGVFAIQIGSVPTALHSKQSGQIMMFGSGTTNPDRVVIQHSPAFPGWGIGYADVGDDVLFMAGGTTNASVDLATGNFTTGGFVQIDQTTNSPAANRLYGNSMPIAYGSIDSLGGISTGYGIASVNNSATGVYEITLDLDSNPANTVVNITPFTIGFGIPEIAGYETTSANTFIVRIQDTSGTARDSAFTFVVYGN